MKPRVGVLADGHLSLVEGEGEGVYRTTLPGRTPHHCPLPSPRGEAGKNEQLLPTVK
jgi:hypothetical protein